MIVKNLTALEKYDLESITPGFIRFWILTWIAAAVVIFICTFAHFESPEWMKAGYTLALIGIYIAFLVPPFLIFKIISKRVKEGTFAIEISLPQSSLRLILSKIKVVALYLIQIAAPFFILALLCDRSFTVIRIFHPAYYNIHTASFPISLLAFLISVLLLVNLWMLVVYFQIRLAIHGADLLVLAGRNIFTILMIIMVLSLIEYYFDGPALITNILPFATTLMILLTGLNYELYLHIPKILEEHTG